MYSRSLVYILRPSLTPIIHPQQWTKSVGCFVFQQPFQFPVFSAQPLIFSRFASTKAVVSKIAINKPVSKAVSTAAASKAQKPTATASKIATSTVPKAKIASPALAKEKAAQKSREREKKLRLKLLLKEKAKKMRGMKQMKRWRLIKKAEKEKRIKNLQRERLRMRVKAKKEKEIEKTRLKRAATLSKKDKKLLKQFPDPNAPKRPLNSYFTYAVKFRKQAENKALGTMSKSNMAAISAAMSQGWKNLLPDSKAKYTLLAAARFKFYSIATEAYKDKNGRQKWLAFLNNHVKNRPPSTGYRGFVKEKFAVATKKKDPKSKASAPIMIQKIVGEWNSLSEKQKMDYQRKYSKLYADWKKKIPKK